MELTTADFKKKFSVNTKKLSRLFASEPTGYIICDAKKKTNISNLEAPFFILMFAFIWYSK